MEGGESLLLRIGGGKTQCLEPGTDIHGYIKEKMGITDYWLSSSPSSGIFEIRLRIVGGKGGFGSQLRSQGSKMSSIKRAGNYEDCRDLTGRRIRHVKDEKAIQEYLKKEPELLRKKQDEKQKYLETKLNRLQSSNLGNKNFIKQNVEFMRKKQENMDNVELAVHEACMNNKGIQIRKKIENNAINGANSSSKHKNSSLTDHVNNIMNEIESSTV